jgi:hypothetical protein
VATVKEAVADAQVEVSHEESARSGFSRFPTSNTPKRRY